MRIGELSRRTGVPVPTIKFYLREGLLPSGELTSHNQAQYGESHLHRLKLVRAMTEVGKLSVAAARDVLATIDEPGLSLHKVLGTAQIAVTPQVAPGTDEAWQQAEQLVTELIGRLGWEVPPVYPARQALEQLVVTIRDLGQDDLLDLLDDYAAAARQLAAAEVGLIGRREGLDSRIEGVVLGTVLGDALIGALRRLAQLDTSRQIFDADAATP
ncbi:MerR family transcriptional regulator [Kitasatospora nipponensis]|uniref:MerR family transcriptional regulator n=1 Tax=Kitasatospora nipponensis TaxID=258049 RepID=A0ABN1WPV7_9ACTN